MIEIKNSITKEILNEWIDMLNNSQSALYLHLYKADGLSIIDSFQQSQDLLLHYSKFLETLESFTYPIYCLTEGYVLGGSLAWVLSSEIHIIVSHTKLKFPEVLIGGFPALVSSCCKRKTQLNRFKYKLLSGETITDKEALEIGLVDKIVSTKEEGILNLNRFHNLYSKDTPTNDLYSSTILLSKVLYSTHTPLVEDFNPLEPTRYGYLKIKSMETRSIAIIYLDYERLQNSFDLESSQWLSRIVGYLRTLQTLIGVIICHGDRTFHFCIGIDTRYLIPKCKQLPYYHSIYIIQQIVESLISLQSLPCPILGIMDGQVNGGGLAFALQCDLLWCTPTTKVLFGTLGKGVSPL